MDKEIFPGGLPNQGALRKIFFRANSTQEINKFSAWLETELKEDDKKRLYNLLRNCCSHRDVLLHHSPEKFKKEFDGIYALKIFQIRLYGFHSGRDFIVFHYMRKKKNRLTNNEKEMIKKKYRECKDENN